MFAALVGYSVMGNSFFDLFAIKGKYYGLYPILIGVFATLAAGVFFDRKSWGQSFVSAGLIIPPLVFLFGAVAGTLSNYAFNGEARDAFDWLGKPMYWLSLVGLPLSIIIGSFYFGFVKVWKDRHNPKLQ